MQKNHNLINYLLFTEIVLLVAFLLAMSGCYRLGHKKTLFIDKELSPYVAAFVTNASAEGKPVGHIDDLIVRFVPFISDTSVLAVCRSGYNITPIVNVSAEKWAFLSHAGKEQLLYHELGHCILDRGHDDRTMLTPLGIIPRSLMVSYQMPDFIYLNNHDYYIHELFNY